MKIIRFCGLILPALFALQCGDPTESSENEPWTALVGRWTAQWNYTQDDDKIVETLYLVFYPTGGYKWTFLRTVNGGKDESKSFVENGQYTATETEIVFAPDGGTPKTYTYVLPGKTDLVMILTDSDGNVINFTDYYKSQYETY